MALSTKDFKETRIAQVFLFPFLKMELFQQICSDLLFSQHPFSIVQMLFLVLPQTLCALNLLVYCSSFHLIHRLVLILKTIFYKSFSFWINNSERLNFHNCLSQDVFIGIFMKKSLKISSTSNRIHCYSQMIIFAGSWPFFKKKIIAF